jgi:hypothetical protein
MAALLLKKTGAIEGACGQIVETAQADVVIKRIHRCQSRGTRSKCHNADEQCKIQMWASDLLKPVNGFTVLFTPRAWLTDSTSEREYAMERIDCSTEINPCELSESQEAGELRLFYEKAKSVGIYPCDYELYRQPDGRLALIDFDKFARWNQKEEIVFPWGAVISNPVYPWSQ